MAEGTRMQQRRAAESVWNTSEYVLAAGELGVTTDSGIIKIGDGTNTWSELDPAFGSEYLTILGKAADSNLLDGIDATGFLQTADADTNATADSIAKRLADGTLRVAQAVTNDDAPRWAQVQSEIDDRILAAEDDLRLQLVGRSVSANFTLELADISRLVLASHASATAFVTATVPLNATLAFPIGSWIDICAAGAGFVKIVGAGGVTINGFPYVYPNYGVSRLLKVGVNTWFPMPYGDHHQQKLPKIRVYQSGSVNYTTSPTWQGVAYDTTDTASTVNPASEWFSIPGTGLATARRIIVNQDGEYRVIMNFSGNQAISNYSRIAKFTADNTPGETLATTSGATTRNVSWQGRLTATTTIGGVQQSVTSTEAGSADSNAVNGNRNDFTIVRVGN